jgi:ribosome-binding ATPase YchF (GTP1/OBG family)
MYYTIEPNVGPGWFGGPVDDHPHGGRDSPHGRDAVGRRVLPCMIKDVAGLVPGAYKVSYIYVCMYVCVYVFR